MSNEYEKIKKWIQRNDFDFIFRENYPLFTIDLLFNSPRVHRGIPGNHHKNYFFYSKNGEVCAYYFTKEIQKSKENSEKFLKINFAKRHFKNSKKIQQLYYKFLSAYRTEERSPEISRKEFLSLLNKYWRIYSDLMAYFRSSRPEIVDPIIFKLENELSKNNLSLTKYKILIRYLTTPFNFDEIRLEQIDWLKILNKKPSKEFYIKHLNKYPWLLPNFYNISEIISSLNLRFKRDVRKKIKIRKEIEKYKYEVNKAKEIRLSVKEIKNFKELNKLSKLIIKLGSDRLSLKCCWTGLNHIIRRFFIKMSDVYNVPVENLVRYYQYNEIIDLIKNNVKLKNDEIKKRKNAYLLISKNDKKIFISGYDANKLISYLSRDYNNKIKGLSASYGFIEVKVKIINFTDIKKFNKSVTEFKVGDIIVSGMTQPNIMPIISKAAAIITDQGGLTSHAAIISREFNIPCIVGTKIATQVLRDGDLIEVDANKGIVKILKRRIIIK